MIGAAITISAAIAMIVTAIMAAFNTHDCDCGVGTTIQMNKLLILLILVFFTNGSKESDFLNNRDR